MGRPYHIIKDNKTTKIPSRFIFVDTETKQEEIKEGMIEHHFRLGVACYMRYRGSRGNYTTNYYNFEFEQDLWDWIESKFKNTTKIILIAHNWDFDMKVLEGFDRLDDRGWQLNSFISGSQLNIWQFTKGNKTMEFVDNMNFFKSSLESLGEAIDIEKMEMPGKTAKKKSWFRYCKRDVEVMVKAWQLWLDFIRDEDLGTFGKTLAKQAFNAYRHRFMPEDLHVHTDEEVIELERDSYHGGRTEAFYIGDPPGEQYYSLDVNSMYPSVMSEYKYPTKLKKYRRNPEQELVLDSLLNGCCIAEVQVDCDVPLYGKKIDNRLCFPVGKFQTTLTTRELSVAFERNHIVDVKSIATYKSDEIFSDYVNYFYGKRKMYERQDLDPFAFMCKLLLNSLYGKFGQKNPNWEDIKKDSDFPNQYRTVFDVDEDEFKEYRIINGLVQCKEGEVEGFHSIVSIPSHVTADARLLLWEFIEKAGRENVFYCDTDSIITNEVGKQRLEEYIKPDELGLLDIEKQDEYLSIKGLKDYQFGNEVVMKGIKEEAKEVEPGIFKQQEFEGIRSALREGRLNRQIVKYKTKKLRREYNKGRVQSNGWVKPFNL